MESSFLVNIGNYMPILVVLFSIYCFVGRGISKLKIVGHSKIGERDEKGNYVNTYIQLNSRCSRAVFIESPHVTIEGEEVIVGVYENKEDEFPLRIENHDKLVLTLTLLPDSDMLALVRIPTLCGHVLTIPEQEIAKIRAAAAMHQSR